MQNKRHGLFVYAGCALLLLALTPIWGFELLYRAALDPPPSLNATQDENIPASFNQALWLSYGESLPMQVTPLWAGNYFRGATRGDRPPGAQVTWRLARLFAPGSGQSRHVVTMLKQSSLSVWFSRHESTETLSAELAREEFFGRGTRGVDSAAHVYFGRAPNELTLGQIAMLAGLVQSPSRFDPSCHPDFARKRRDYMLRALRKSNAITQDEMDTAIAEPLQALAPSQGCARPSSEDE